MPTFLFNEIIFGPVKSRRLGVSLGINLLPLDSKLCNFDCIYCECGRTFKIAAGQKKFHSRTEVEAALRLKLTQMKIAQTPPDVITYAGNGEPTMHPEFAGIIDDTVALRNEIFPKTRIAVLSNATMIHKEKVRKALSKIEQNILKLDSAVEETIRLINNPPKNFTLSKLIENLLLFEGNCTIQTLFLQGEYNGKNVDNTTEFEINSWLNALKIIKPRNIMIYTIDRDTPSPGLKKASIQKLNEIAEYAKLFGFRVDISG
jgi:wyosine [tRNA(Phe)-imidazoG37] synthetase (radical SAM superfamily)